MKQKSVHRYRQEPYSRIVIPVEGGGYHAEILEFPGCYAQGKSVQQAYRNLERAAEAWIKATASEGHDVPKPFSSLGYGGKIALRLPKSVHKRATQMAQRDRTSLNSFLLSAVSARVGAGDYHDALIRKFETHVMGAFQTALTLYHKVSVMPKHVGAAADVDALPATVGTSGEMKI
jgi:predicted RNase H-like HicB family nuclease